jgi:hypothetical protein
MGRGKSQKRKKQWRETEEICSAERLFIRLVYNPPIEMNQKIGVLCIRLVCCA